MTHMLLGLDSFDLWSHDRGGFSGGGGGVRDLTLCRYADPKGDPFSLF